MSEDIDDRKEKREKSAAAKQRELKAAWQSVLASREGRIVLASILGRCGIEAVNAHDGPAAFRQEGQRYVGLTMVRDMKAVDLPGYLRLYKEMNDVG